MTIRSSFVLNTEEQLRVEVHNIRMEHEARLLLERMKELHTKVITEVITGMIGAVNNGNDFQPVAPCPEKKVQPQYAAGVVEAFRTMQHAVHKNAVEHGWWDKPSEDGTCLALMHRELSECTEALRDGNPPDKHCPEHGNALVELADTVIRIMDFCERKGWNLGKAIVAKHEYNKKRPYMHGGKEF